MVIKPAFIESNFLYTLKYILCNSDFFAVLETCDTFFSGFFD